MTLQTVPGQRDKDRKKESDKGSEVMRLYLFTAPNTLCGQKYVHLTDHTFFFFLTCHSRFSLPLLTMRFTFLGRHSH